MDRLGTGGALSPVVSAVVLLLVFAVSDVKPLVGERRSSSI
jgi:hypothetical protein